MNVLIADDDKLARDSLAENINWASYGLTLLPCAENGKVALSLIEQYDVDILITDIKMPFLTGFELIKASNEKGFFPATIIISGYDDKEYLQEAIKLNIIVGYIFKPVQLGQLNSTIKETVEFRKNWKRTVNIPKFEQSSIVRYSYENYIIEIRTFETIHKHLSSGNIEKAQNTFNEIWSEFKKSNKDINYVKRFCWEFVISMLQLTAKTGLDVDIFFYASDPLAEISALTGFDKIEEYISNFIKSVYTCLHDYQSEQSPYAKYLAQAILTRYSEPGLSMQTLSVELGVTANYLSALYKRKHGTNFLADLTEMRLNTAKQLLCSSEIKVSKIALNVGFNDPKYFTNVFKENVGLTPTEFKARFRAK